MTAAGRVVWEVPELSAEASALFLAAVEAGSVPRSPNEGGPVLVAAAASPADELVRAGLLRGSVDDSTVWIPVDPASAATQLERRAREAWGRSSRLEEEWAELTGAFRRLRSDRGNDLVRYVEGKAAIAQQLNLLWSGAKKEVLTVQPGPARPKEVLDASFPEDVALMRRGVQRRIIYQTPARRHVHTQHYVHAVTAAGAEVRTADELPERVFIIDDAVVHPLAGDPEVAVIITDMAVVAFHRRLFDHLWQQALPFGAPAPEKPKVTEGTRWDQLSPAQKRIVRMALKDGLTHDAIAQATGMSVRTVRRQLEIVRKIYDDAPTGMALGARIGGEYPEGLPAD